MSRSAFLSRVTTLGPSPPTPGNAKLAVGSEHDGIRREEREDQMTVLRRIETIDQGPRVALCPAGQVIGEDVDDNHPRLPTDSLQARVMSRSAR